MNGNPTHEPALLPLVRIFGRRSPWIVGAATALLFGLVGSIAIVVGANQGVPVQQLDDATAQLWVNSLATGYVIGVLLYETRRLTGDFEQLRPHLWNAGKLDDPHLFLRNHHPIMLGAVTLAGVVFGACFNYSTDGVLYQALNGRTLAWAYAWGPLLLVSLWTAAFHVFWIMLDNSRLFARIGRDHLRVDLDRLANFDVFANAGIRQLLMIIVGLSVIPVQAIMTGRLNPIDFAPALAIALPVGLVLLVMPIYGAHQAIAAQIRRELDRVEHLLEQAPPHRDRYLLLSLYRHQLAATPAWPLSLRSLARIVIYLVIPPLAWIAAALVQSLVTEAL